MNDLARQFRDFFVSLKLTVVLLVLSLVLVFVATLDQVNLGIWAVQEKYFRSFFVLWNVKGIPVPVFPGGYLIGGFLLVNLVAAHVYRFSLTWRKAGIQLTHGGLILLLLGELFTGLLQEDFSMRLEQGVPRNYSESFRDNELVVVDTTDPKTDEVVAIPESLLRAGASLQHPRLPFRLVVKDYYPNSALQMKSGAAPGAPQATQGIGTTVTAAPQPLTYKQDERNIPAAWIEVTGDSGPIGTWLVTTIAGTPTSAPILRAAQTFQHAGRSYSIAMRFTRSYKPFTLTLQKFSHDKYSGTEIPKNFSSRIRLETPAGKEDREVLVYMNNPLRYDGFTFYQASFEPGNDKVTVLQVVRNPSWLIPYVACSIMTLGLIWQFWIHLSGFIAKRARQNQAA
ncbi:MAG: cytochrome c biogenesis protein ResB [Opitutaceae bacterium]